VKSAVTPSPEDISKPEIWILAIAKDRDRASFIALYRSFAPRVKGYLMRHSMRVQLAEELTQETFLTVWRKAEQFDPQRASAAAWIYTIARNLHVDVVRRERHSRAAYISEWVSAPATPEEDLKVLEGEKRIHAALEALPTEQATVLRMAFFQNQTHVEIANALGLPLGTVKSRIRLASAHLRSALDDLI
jgi:RNA polymerase sigma-70 factor, ECF subfamily